MSGLLMKYFVLKPDIDHTDPYGQASLAGMTAYARSIEEVNPELASDLDEWVDSFVSEHAVQQGC